MTAEHTPGRPIEESRALARASADRYDRVGAVWDELTDDEQMSVVALAERLARAVDEADR